MKSCLAALVLLCLVGACRAQTLLTDNYQVNIKVQCPEGNVTCDKVRYAGTNRKTGKTIELTGRTVHTTCADGITPCRFLGYQFRNGAVTYSVWERADGDGATLAVSQGSRVLLEERGTWQ
jgi:hypothetical protein